MREIAWLIPLAALGQAVIDPKAGPKPGYKFEMKQGPLAPRPAPIEPEPGDTVTVRADGSIAAASRSRSLTIPVANRMEPRVRVSYGMAGSRVRYEYVVSNGARALNTIGPFEFSIGGPFDIDAPEPWKSLAINKPHANPSTGFYRHVQDSDRRGALKAGVTLGAIRLVSDRAPGLIETTFHPDPADGLAAGRAYGGFFDWASPWVRQRLAEIDTPDRRLLRGLTIGPTAPLATDSFERIRLEIQDAARREQMPKQPIPATPAALENWLKDVRKLAVDGIVADFADAMLWRLRQLH